MKKLAPFLALLVAGVALAAEPVVTVLVDPADAKAAAEAQASCDAACRTTKVWRARLVQAEAEEARAKEARARALATLGTKLGVKGALSVRVTTSVDGDGVETRTVSLVSQE